jgi:GNAT superfamily N-acetyltransferase
VAARIVAMPADGSVRIRAASLAVEQWRGDFPHDTESWYLDLYAAADDTEGLPVVLAAMDNGVFLGTGSLIADDELPGAPEPGPWIAALYVEESARRRGIGEALVGALVERAGGLGHEVVYLYTQHGESWYHRLGWTTLRTARLADHDVAVMSRRT